MDHSGAPTSEVVALASKSAASRGCLGERRNYLEVLRKGPISKPATKPSAAEARLSRVSPHRTVQLFAHLGRIYASNLGPAELTV